MISIILAATLIQATPAKPQLGETQCLQVLRKGAEMYVRFKFIDTPPRDLATLGESFQMQVERFLSEHDSYLKSAFRSDDEAFRELLTGYASVLSTLGKAEKEADEATTRTDLTPKEQIDATMRCLQIRGRLPKALSGLRTFMGQKVPTQFQEKLSPPAYYMLISPMIKSTGNPEWTSFTATFATPDFDFGTECLLANFFQTNADAEAYHIMFQAAVKSAGDDITKQVAAVGDSKVNLRKYSSAKPGDTIFAIRKRDVGEWMYVKDWKQLSKKIDYLKFVAKLEDVDILVGKSKGEARPVPATLW